MRIIFLGDIVGDKSVEAVGQFIAKRRNVNPDAFYCANAENASGGYGLSENHYRALLRAGFSLLSGGNHIWDKKDVLHYITEGKLARPANLPSGTPGPEYVTADANGKRLAIVNVLGRTFMQVSAMDCPFRTCDRVLERIRQEGIKHVIVDVHGEATSEKASLAHYLDGRVTAVVGSHTHVPTADARTLPKGTAFVTDIGACMAAHSVIGFQVSGILQKFLTGMPSKAQVAGGEIVINAVEIIVSPSAGVTISRISEENRDT